MVGTNRRPAACYRVLRGSVYDNFRRGIFAISTKERFTVGIESGKLGIYSIYRVMITAFAVFCLMIKGRAVNLHFTGTEVTLEVCHIIHGIPQTEFYIREYGNFFVFAAVVGQCQFVNLTGISQRNKHGQLCG